jgi:predicted DCC family thiol-disulfide oxidoreductase YuxK
VVERAPAGRVSARPSQEPGLIERYGLTREDVTRYAWAIEPDGRRLRGAAAIGRVLGELGGGWRLIARLTRLPGSGLVYAVVARVRGRLSSAWGDPPPYP